MEKPAYHEIVAPIKEIGSLVMGWAKDIILPPEAVDLPAVTERTYQAMTAPYEDMQG